MSMNLALVRHGEINTQDVYQTPTAITHAAMRAENTTQYYKDWVTKQRKGNFQYATDLHFERIDFLLRQGYTWKVI